MMGYEKKWGNKRRAHLASGEWWAAFVYVAKGDKPVSETQEGNQLCHGNPWCAKVHQEGGTDD